MSKQLTNFLQIPVYLFLSISSLGHAIEFNKDNPLELNAHFITVGGVSTGEVEELANHGHDPNQDFTIQGIELGVNFRPTSFLEGFASVNTFLNLEDELESEWEEGFLKLKDISGGFEVRGGAFLTRIGLQNQSHLHSWDFVDSNLSTSIFLGEESLFTEGAELSWYGNIGDAFVGISSSFGRAREHSHDHGEEDHDHDEGDHEGEEHGDEEEHHDEEEHGHSESIENAYFGNDLFVTRAFVRYNYNDFHQHQFGGNLAAGDNGFNRNTQLYSFDYQYTWRENGLEAGGRAVQAQLEYIFRNVEWSEEDRQGYASQSSFMASLAYTFVEDWTVAARYGWIEGVQESPEFHMGEIEYGFEAEEVERLSLALTRRVTINSDWSGHVRLQYNYDDREELGSSNTVWLQLQIDFGPGEIR